MESDVLVCGKYKLCKKIGSGSFGEIFHAIDINTNEVYAIKLENSKIKCPQLSYESKVLELLAGVGIPKVHFVGTESEYNVLVMELLGPSLELTFEKMKCKFTLKTVLMIANQLVSRIEYIHSKLFIHRDIKPENFLLGLGTKSNFIYAIDFGLSRRYRDPNSKKHLEFKNNKNLTGTARYASINAHMGLEQSRRDDLEAIFYVLLYFLRGQLPWQGLPAKNKEEKYRKIMESKMSTPIEILCQFSPEEFKKILTYIKALKFEEDPNYSMILAEISNMFSKNKIENDYLFDWIIFDVYNHINPVVNINIQNNYQNQNITIINSSKVMPPIINDHDINKIKQTSQIISKLQTFDKTPISQNNNIINLDMVNAEINKNSEKTKDSEKEVKKCDCCC